MQKLATQNFINEQKTRLVPRARCRDLLVYCKKNTHRAFGWNGVDNLSNFSPAVTFSRQPSRSAVVGVLCTPRRGAPPPLNPPCWVINRACLYEQYQNSLRLSFCKNPFTVSSVFFVFPVPLFLIIRRLSRTWQPKTKSLNLSRTIIDSFTLPTLDLH